MRRAGTPPLHPWLLLLIRNMLICLLICQRQIQLIIRLALQRFDDAAFKRFQDYISNRTQCIDTKGLKSKVVAIENGVPQGSVLDLH